MCTAQEMPHSPSVAVGQALCSACAKMCVRFLRSSESPHVSVFYLSATSLTVSLCATLIPKALGYHGSIRMPNCAMEWAFLAGVGAACAAQALCMPCVTCEQRLCQPRWVRASQGLV